MSRRGWSWKRLREIDEHDVGQAQIIRWDGDVVKCEEALWRWSWVRDAWMGENGETTTKQPTVSWRTDPRELCTRHAGLVSRTCTRRLGGSLLKPWWHCTCVGVSLTGKQAAKWMHKYSPCSLPSQPGSARREEGQGKQAATRLEWCCGGRPEARPMSQYSGRGMPHRKRDPAHTLSLTDLMTRRRDDVRQGQATKKRKATARWAGGEVAVCPGTFVALPQMEIPRETNAGARAARRPRGAMRPAFQAVG
ncbi:hypothetical protein BKA81DRAFT_378508 [Phyllosticta paracitricarpa]